MSQHDYNIANQTGLEFRSDLNNALSAIVTDNSGATAPTSTFAGMMWRDTSISPSVLKKRNDTNSGWVTVLTPTGEALSGAASVAAQRTALGLGSAALLNVGTTASSVVQLDASAKLPALDGSQLTNLPSTGLSAASTAQAQAGTSDTVAITPLKLRQGLNASGTAPVYACRAWVNFNGTGTVSIRRSGNVSSITDNGVGSYTVNFTSAMPDANYAVEVSMQKEGLTGDETGPSLVVCTSGSVQVINKGYDNAYRDSPMVCVSVFC